MSTKTRWYQERQKESYYQRAKKEGYRARSAYKIQQIHERFTVVRKGEAVADLGAAPGGWSQVLVELVGPQGLVVGVDLQRIKPIQGATFMQGDFTQRSTHDKLSAILAEKGRSALDAVVSDMAPDMSGNYETDQVRSVHLAEMALDFADKHLRQGGAFVCKVFEGADFPEFRAEVKRRFKRMHQYHPAASRKSSSEVYLVGKHYLGPKAATADKGDEEDDAPLSRAGMLDAASDE
ncbi:MAG TPA: RlmE family RNA methyltransferase [Candidatus Thermoplasmatota archaeon]|nr:RlmE family RNA methyltransferase [Candidatus Thermoplasmatota archaeon]